MATGLQPVLLVHGIWDSAARIEPLARALRARGLGPLRCFDLEPNDGRAKIAELAAQVAREVEGLRTSHGCEPVDVVGFSMGALAARCYIQRFGGKERVRRFVSISGPHAGTVMAYALPFEGAREMRPGSELLRGLEADPDPWGPVEVHCLYTRYDLMILPPRSSLLRGALRTHELGVPLHRLMIRDPRAIELVVGALR